MHIRDKDAYQDTYQACVEDKHQTHQGGFTQPREVFFNCREQLSAFLSTEATAEEKLCFIA